jgi:hypothetical protein
VNISFVDHQLGRSNSSNLEFQSWELFETIPS